MVSPFTQFRPLSPCARGIAPAARCYRLGRVLATTVLTAKRRTTYQTQQGRAGTSGRLQERNSADQAVYDEQAFLSCARLVQPCRNFLLWSNTSALSSRTLSPNNSEPTSFTTTLFNSEISKSSTQVALRSDPLYKMRTSGFQRLSRVKNLSFSFALPVVAGLSSVAKMVSPHRPNLLPNQVLPVFRLFHAQSHVHHQHNHSPESSSSHDHRHSHGHSHGMLSFHHHHHKGDAHGADLLLSADKSDAGVRITRIGLMVNLAMAVSKGVGGYIFHSQALTADAVHSMTDLVSDFMTLGTISLALKPPTKRFPNGYGRFETLGSLGVSSILLFGGALMGWAAVLDLCHIYLPAVAHFWEQIGLAGHSHSHHHGIPNIQAAWLAGGSIVIKEWLYRATMKVAREKRSQVLESNAVHHRVDSLTAIAALVSIAASNIFPAFHGIDALGSLLITYLVVRTGWGNTIAALTELAGEGLDPSVSSEVHRHAQNAIEEMAKNMNYKVSTPSDLAGRVSRISKQVPAPSPSPDLPDSDLSDIVVTDTDANCVTLINIRGVKAGQNFLIDMAIEVPVNWTTEKCHMLETTIRNKVCRQMGGVRRVNFRFLTIRMISSDERMLDGFGDQFVMRPRLKANNK